MATFDAIFWINAEHPSSMANGFSDIVINLGLAPEESADARDRVVSRELVKGWLAKPVKSYSTGPMTAGQEAKWLIVFDNVEDPHVLMEYWPSEAKHGSILITTRDARAVKMGAYPITKGILLPPLQIDDAAQLLLDLTRRTDDVSEKEISISLARKLDGYPLAIVHMAGIAVSQDLGFADILALYDEESTHDNLFGQNAAPTHLIRTSYEHTLATVFRLETLQYSMGLLQIMALLDPLRIPEEVLKAGIGKGLLSNYPDSARDYMRAKTELTCHSLARFEDSAFSVHRMVQDNARAKLLSSPKLVSGVFNAAIEVLHLVWPFSEQGVRNSIVAWQKCAIYVPHVERVQEHLSRAGKIVQDAVKLNIAYAELLLEMGWYFMERGFIEDAMHYFKSSEANVSSIIAGDTLSEHDKSARRAEMLLAEAHISIGGVAMENNNADTALYHCTIYKDLLEQEVQITGQIDDQRLIVSYYDLGLSHIMKGNYEDATMWLQRGIQEAERLKDPDKVKEARSLALINTGMTLYLMAEPEEAEKTLFLALLEREELHGVNDRESMKTGRILHLLGNTRQMLGDPQASLTYHQRALLHFQETTGDSHHRTGNSCYKVARHFSAMCLHADALPLLEQASKIFRSRKGYRGELGRVLLLRSEVYAALCQPANASKDRREAERLGRELRGIGCHDPLDHSTFDPWVHVWGR
ncbi:Hypothetical protein D9617_4g004090 [Elsinoe fawcettii]|nr:Hypothetical protein D9617_4g004090 [Elsinoe fawcettii]